MQNKG